MVLRDPDGTGVLHTVAVAVYGGTAPQSVRRARRLTAAAYSAVPVAAPATVLAAGGVAADALFASVMAAVFSLIVIVAAGGLSPHAVETEVGLHRLADEADKVGSLNAWDIHVKPFDDTAARLESRVGWMHENVGGDSAVLAHRLAWQAAVRNRDARGMTVSLLERTRLHSRGGCAAPTDEDRDRLAGTLAARDQLVDAFERLCDSAERALAVVGRDRVADPVVLSGTEHALLAEAEGTSWVLNGQADELDMLDGRWPAGLPLSQQEGA